MTDWNSWLEANEPDGANELLALHDALVIGGDYGCYAGTHGPQGRVFIKGCIGPQLALVSEKAARTFLSVLEARYASGMEIEAFHGLEMALSRDKS